MSKFNTPAAKVQPRSAVIAEAVPSGTTYEGGSGYARPAKSELFLLAVSHLGDGSFYEGAPERDTRFRSLTEAVTAQDPEWMAGFIPWLRDGANMRTASVVAAAEAARALLAAAKPGGRKLIASTLKRSDEPGELLAYWHSRYGRVLPKPVKRGLADAVSALYSEYALLKYDTASHGYRFADVIELTHPSPSAPWQGDLFKYAIDRRHGQDTDGLPGTLAMLAANGQLRVDAGRDPSALLDRDRLKRAGMTWEDVLSLAGSKLPKKDLWTAMIPSMGIFALVRNLRNFDDAGVPDHVAAQVTAKLTDPAVIAKSRMFPFRFLAAYNAAASLRWAYPLEQALNLSLASVPALKGRTLVLVDRSLSMWGRNMSDHSAMTWADAAGVFGAAVALRADHADLAEFSGYSAPVPFRRADSVLKLTERFHKGDGTHAIASGTDIPSAVRKHFAGHDRVVIVTDEQTRPGWLPSNMAGYGGGRDALIDDLIPRHVPLYLWNFGGYSHGATPSGTPGRHTFGGLTDQAFRAVPMLEAGRDAAWPWLEPVLLDT